MGLKEWIIPQDRVFYDLMERHARLTREACQAFQAMVEGWPNTDALRVKVAALEHEADLNAHDVFERLNRTFVTPVDREDIARLTHAIDDVIDATDAAASRIGLYELPAATQDMKEMARLLASQAQHVEDAVRALRKPKTMATRMPPHFRAIHQLENDADAVLNQAVARMFKEQDAVTIMKHKEIVDLLEVATDRCEDVADVLQDITRKHG